MQLDIGSFPINKIVFDPETRLNDDVLKVSRREMEELIQGDPRIAEVKIEIVEAGE